MVSRSLRNRGRQMCALALALLALLVIYNYGSGRRNHYTTTSRSPAFNIPRPLSRKIARKVRRARETRPAGFVSSRKLSTEVVSRFSSSSSNPPNDHRLSLAIVRPISPSEALVDSFDAWFDHPLGQKCQRQDYNADLIISFSQFLDDYPDIRKAIEAVRSLHKETGGWGGCIRSIKMFEAGIPAGEDLYDPSVVEAGDSRWQNWVNGPNRHFERAFRHVESLGVYDAMFLMESDTYPISANWLDNLVGEIEASAPFALLGSKYEGNGWDDFADHMPLALLHHLNGNGVYNVSHPLMDHIVSELEAESTTAYNAICYDYRISQMLLEASSGIHPKFPYENVVDNDGKAVVLAPKPKFAKWWNDYSDQEPVKESNVITNIATTAFLLDEVDDGISLVHGKNLYLPWDPNRHGTVSLVVSDFGAFDDKSKDFLGKMNSIQHPFSEIILVEDSKSSDDDLNFVRKWAQTVVGVPVVVQRRTGEPDWDLCSAEVSTDYFVMTDVNFVPADNIQLMFASDDTNRPVVPYVPSESVRCANFKECTDMIEQARAFYPQIDHYFLPDEILFRNNLTREFCNELRRREQNEGLFQSEAVNKITTIYQYTPTATNYMAYLHWTDDDTTSYHQINAIVQGTRKYFVPAKPRIPLGLKYHVADLVDTEGRVSELPLLWSIPESGGASMTSFFSECLQLPVASSSGAHLERERSNIGQEDLPESLYYVVDENGWHISVDVSTPGGIEKAKELDLIGSGLSGAIVTPLLTNVALNLFNTVPDQRARVSAFFRHPVDRAVLVFHHLRKATWERTHDPSFANMTIEEYAKSNKAESNWMVRMLNDDSSTVVDERHLKVAKEILRKKVLIGLTSEFTESARRIYSYFGLKQDGKKWNLCEKRHLFEGEANSNSHQFVDEETEVWRLLAEKNSLDVQLYEYAVELFEKQGRDLLGKKDATKRSIFSGEPNEKETEYLRDVLDFTLERRMNQYPGKSSKSSKAPTTKSSKAPTSKSSKSPKMGEARKENRVGTLASQQEVTNIFSLIPPTRKLRQVNQGLLQSHANPICPSSAIETKVHSSKAHLPPEFRIVSPNVTITPTWQTSFPGSGADMTGAFIQGLTGLVFESAECRHLLHGLHCPLRTIDDFATLNDPGERTVSVKTHYPDSQDFPPPDKFNPHEYMHTAILLLRHPMTAIPSLHNWRYEQDNGNVGHSTRAPLKEWVVWRDEHYEKMLRAWVKHTTYWLDQYTFPGPGGNRFISVYERITHDVDGPKHAQLLAEFLDSIDENIRPAIDPSVVACIWHKYLKTGKAQAHRHGSKYRPLRDEQIDMTVEALSGLKRRYEGREDASDILPIFDVYLEMAEEKRKEEPTDNVNTQQLRNVVSLSVDAITRDLGAVDRPISEGANSKSSRHS